MATENRFIAARKANVKNIKFVGQEISIVKLAVGQVLEIQELAKIAEANKDKGDAHIDMIFSVVRMGAPELEELTDDELKQLPMEEVSELSNEIMKYSGLGNKSK